MQAPTGKLKFAYQTIANMEGEIIKQKAVIAKQQELIDKVIATQKKFYGDCTGLHLEMIDLVRELKCE